MFSNCTIDGAGSQDGNYSLGRPWQNAPRAVYLNTKMNILPSAGAWVNMSTIPALFAEYGSVNASNYPVDLSARNTFFSYTDASSQVITGSSPTAVLTEQEAAGYTIAKVLGGTDSWDATVKAETTSSPENLIINHGVLSWTPVDGAICYIVVSHASVHAFTTETTIPVDEQTVYSVIAVSKYGALSVAASNDLTATSTIESVFPALKSNLVVDRLEFSYPDQIKKVRIINLNGYSFSADIAGKSNIDIAHLEPGFFMAQITSLDNRAMTFKFLKK